MVAILSPPAAMYAWPLLDPGDSTIGTPGAMPGGPTLSAAPESITVRILIHSGLDSSFHATFRGIASGRMLTGRLCVVGSTMPGARDADTLPKPMKTLKDILIAQLDLPSDTTKLTAEHIRAAPAKERFAEHLLPP